MARAIDGEAAYRFLSKQLVKETGAFSKGVNKGLNIARSAMRNPDAIPTLTPPNEWMSVKDALPPKHESVLCIVSGKPKPNITLEDAYQLGSWNKADGWIIDEWLDWEGANVTWWMKLPEPPDRRPPEGEPNA